MGRPKSEYRKEWSSILVEKSTKTKLQNLRQFDDITKKAESDGAILERLLDFYKTNQT